MNGIPVVALSDYDGGGDGGGGGGEPGSEAGRKDFCDTLRGALCELGFVRVESHGIDPALVRRVYSHCERFFEGPEADKLACSGVPGGQRGFTPFGVEHAKGHAAPDLKEFFHIGPEPAGAYPENRWPASLPALREDGLLLFRALEACAARLLEALAEAFGLERSRFAELIVGGNSILRAVHYPALPSVPPLPSLGSPDGAASPGAPRDPASVRAAAHEDINLITLLCEATDAGLEIRPPGSSEWIAVEVPPGQIVVDSGDMLSRLTNDVVPATTHRVVNPPGATFGGRYSLPFFAHPRPECDLSVLPAFTSEERPARYPPITAGGYLQERLREIGLVS